MSFDYARLAKTSLDQIAKFGRSVTFRAVTAGTFDTSTGTKSGASEDDTTLKALFTDYKDSQIDGEVIMRGDKRVLIAGSSLTTPPKTNDVVVDDTNYKVVSVDTVKPGDTVLLYKLQVRK